MGRTMRQIKDASNDLQTEIKKTTGDLKGELNLKELIDDTARDVRRPLDQYAADIEDVMKRKPTNSLPKVKPKPPVASTDAPEIPEAPKVPKIEPIKPVAPKNEPSTDS